MTASSESMPEDVNESLRLIEDLKFFLVTAPANWQENQVIRRYYLNNDEGFVSCVFWKNLYFITGTDIVRCILYKFQHFGRTIVDRKKFEEGIFSDLRNLKAGADAILERPKSEFLEFLYKNSCLRTQKKQKVFYWFNVPHDKLMADALDRDLKREKAGQQTTSVPTKEPALSFKFREDSSTSLLDQLNEHLMNSKAPDAGEPLKKSPLTPPLLQGENNLQSELQPGISSSASLLDLYPSQYAKDGPEGDDDDDFPLDYFGREPPGYGPGDHIALESAHHTGSFMNDPNFELMDSSFLPSAQQSTNVATTEDYLIEQTQPSKPPAMTCHSGSSAQMDNIHFAPGTGSTTPLAMNAAAAQMQQQYPYPYSMPAYHGPVMAGAPSATGMHGPGFMPPYQGPASAMYNQFWDPTFSFLPEQPISGLMPQDEGWPYELQSPYMGYYEKEFEPQMYSSRPSLRQREISYSMMRKRRQIQNSRGVFKPLHGRTDRNVSLDVESRIKEKIKRTLDLQGSLETLMPTPESSVNQQ